MLSRRTMFLALVAFLALAAAAVAMPSHEEIVRQRFLAIADHIQTPTDVSNGELSAVCKKLKEVKETIGACTVSIKVDGCVKGLTWKYKAKISDPNGVSVTSDYKKSVNGAVEDAGNKYVAAQPKCIFGVNTELPIHEEELFQQQLAQISEQIEEAAVVTPEDVEDQFNLGAVCKKLKQVQETVGSCTVSIKVEGCLTGLKWKYKAFLSDPNGVHVDSGYTSSVNGALEHLFERYMSLQPKCVFGFSNEVQSDEEIVADIVSVADDLQTEVNIMDGMLGAVCKKLKEVKEKIGNCESKIRVDGCVKGLTWKYKAKISDPNGVSVTSDYKKSAKGALEDAGNKYVAKQPKCVFG